MRIFLNPESHYGHGLEIWERIQPEVRQKFGPFEVEEIHVNDFHNQIQQAVENGESQFVAAGGDGTVNLLVNELMKNGFDRKSISLGAIGLGSSNDFHKPVHKNNKIAQIPVRLDFRQVQETDVIRIKYLVPGNGIVTKFAIINASIGITAQANALYNSRERTIQWFQKHSVEAAILLTALKTIFTYRNIPAVIHFENGETKPAEITNLGIIKNPHFAGNLCYDTSIKFNDGQLCVNLGAAMNRFEAVRALLALYRGKFSQRSKTFSRKTTRLRVSSNQNFALEMDGEVVLTSSVEFEVLPKAVRCCR